MEQSAAPPRLSEKINADGFRRWHEYELTRSFGYLGLGVLALIAALTILEGSFDATSRPEKIFKTVLSFCTLCFAAWSWQRFIHILLFAEHISKQAVCMACKRYGQLTVVGERPSGAGEGSLTCRCKKCASEWEMGYTVESRHDRS